MQKLKNFITEIIDIDDNEWLEIRNSLKIISYKKGDILIKEGDIFKNILFINSGIVRSYLIDNKGRDFTWQIHYSGENVVLKNNFVVDYASFTHQEPSKLFFEVIEDSELVLISYNFLQDLYNLSEKWQKFGKIIAEMAYYQTHHRTLSLLSETADVKYKKLLEEDAILLQKVPQYYIASYLGITPQSLSRIRKKIHS